MLNQHSSPEEINNMSLLERFQGAFVGGAIGDALGFITEFVRDSAALKRNTGVSHISRLIDWRRPTKAYSKDLVHIPLPKGIYSDDTQLTLATARSIRPDGRFDVTIFSKYELPLWLEYQLGGGVSTKVAARNLLKQKNKWFNNFYRQGNSNYIHSGGNGAAMRILPLALVHFDHPGQRYRDIWKNVICTHGHLRALIGALLFADTIALICKGERDKQKILNILTDQCDTIYPGIYSHLNKIPEFGEWKQLWEYHTKTAFDKALEDVSTEAIRMLSRVVKAINTKDSPNHLLSDIGCFASETKGSGLATVIAALYFFHQFDNLEESLIAIANIYGIDTDTIGFFSGSILGCYIGINSINNSAKNDIMDFKYLLEEATRCHNIRHKQEINEFEIIEYIYPNFNKKDLLNNKKEGDTVIIPHLGKGSIKSIKTIRTRSNSFLNFYLLFLEIGQTIPIIYESNTISEQNSSEINTINSIEILDYYKKKVLEENFDSHVIVDLIRDIRFSKNDRSLYTAFCTWLWGTIENK